MTHNNEKAPEQGGEKELTPMAAHPPQTTTVMKSKEDIYQIIESAVGGLRAQAIMKDLFDEIISASQNNQGEGNCKCDNEIKIGQTSAMCCNICGLPDDENWKVPSPLPGATAPSAVQAEALKEYGRMVLKSISDTMLNPNNLSKASLNDQAVIQAVGETILTFSLPDIASLSAPQDEGWVKEISEERKRQDAKWGEQNHAPADWLMILGEEVGEVNKAALEAKFGGKTLQEYREELIQVASVAVAMIQCFDRNSPPNS